MFRQVKMKLFILFLSVICVTHALIPHRSSSSSPDLIPFNLTLLETKNKLGMLPFHVLRNVRKVNLKIADAEIFQTAEMEGTEILDHIDFQAMKDDIIALAKAGCSGDPPGFEPFITWMQSKFNIDGKGLAKGLSDFLKLVATLDVIAPLTEQEKADELADGDISTIEEQRLTTILQTLVEYTAFSVLVQSPYSTTKFGTELTFNGPSAEAKTWDGILGEEILKKIPDGTDIKTLKKPVGNRIAAWETLMSAAVAWAVPHPTVPHTNIVVTRTVVQGSDPKWGIKVPKFTYSWTDPTTNRPLTFWWQISIDPGCLELQMKPCTMERFQNPVIQNIIEQDIFAASKHATVGVAPNPTSSGGGGHLSIDTYSGFGWNPLVLYWFTYLYTKSIGYFEYFDEDFDNSPFLFQLENWGTSNYPKGKKFSGLDLEPTGTWDTYREKQERIYNKLGLYYALAREESDKVKMRTAALHFQAINIEKAGSPSLLFDPDTLKEAQHSRIEMRHYAAQPDYDTLIKEIRDLCDVLRLSRVLTIYNSKVKWDPIPEVDYDTSVKIHKSTCVLSGSTSASWRESQKMGK